MTEKQLNNISNVLIDLLPQNWDKVVYRSIVDKDYYESIFYVYVKDKWLQCYELPEMFSVTEDEIDDAFATIYKEYQASKIDWSSVTITITCDYHVAAVFEYNAPVSFDTWKQQYIK